MASNALPLVESVQVLDNLRYLVSSHNGCLPLEATCAGYKRAFGKMPVDPKDLEYLLVILRGLGVQRKRYIVDVEASIEHQEKPTPIVESTTIKSARLDLFRWELFTLLKDQPKRQIPLDEFHERFKHHIGRNCRVCSRPCNMSKSKERGRTPLLSYLCTRHLCNDASLVRMTRTSIKKNLPRLLSLPLQNLHRLTTSIGRYSTF